MKKYIKGFVKEIIPVFFGVLIALWINNWNEERKDKKYIDNFYSSLKKELSDTNKEMIKKRPSQKKLVDTLDFYSKNNTISLLQVISKAGGINGPLIKLNYWNALSNSKIELISYEKLAILTEIEEGKSLLKYKRNKLIDFIYSNMTKTTKEEKIVLKIMILELMNTEKQVQRNIQKILNE
ncbi:MULTISPECIES: hypothetical protein [unclassified Tenacibaculum]|uniref:hypothetical protein n=1 Tax=unclassified Tenacibaculum TaxID=2635139 RepID=UPI001F42CDD8|nr:MULTISPECIES: hypothetical protein [unclassified Tenacibaculum]MCF2873238.1 hypothetical protein [Tenacibaculum sp. Cn5-1]MCF2933394.1 hypothetical protein [Tenacibaculum sp. Cn5-34]MCG7510025.1 hypothetical protein [Tenacibaculum sp. Cn5-46]